MVFATILLYFSAFCTIIVLSVVIYFFNIYNYWKRKNAPYVKPVFPFGNLKDVFLLRESLPDTLRKLHMQIKGDFGGVYFFATPAVVIKSPELIKHILVQDFSTFHDRGVYTDPVSDPLSVHLFRLEGLPWKNLRNKLSPTFTSGKLKVMFPHIVENGRRLLNHLRNSEGTIIEAKHLCVCFGVNIICSVAFGLDVNSFENSDDKMIILANRILAKRSLKKRMENLFVFCNPGVLRMLGIRTHPKYVTEFVIGLIARVVKYRETNKVTRNDFLQLLIQLKNKGVVLDDDAFGDASIYDIKDGNISGLSLNDMAAQAYVFFVAGYDTSSNTMTFTLYELSKQPDIQNRLRKEIRDVLAKYNGEITYNSIKEMTYLDQVVSETLRLYPAVPLLNRVAAKDYKIPNTDVVIEKGTPIDISLLGLHHDPDNFPNPEIFDPERFSPENIDKIKPFSYLPFGEGPRICIGMRMGKMQTKTGLAMILNEYEFNTCEDTPKEIVLTPGTILLYTEQPVMLKIKKAES